MGDMRYEGSGPLLHKESVRLRTLRKCFRRITLATIREPGLVAGRTPQARNLLRCSGHDEPVVVPRVPPRPFRDGRCVQRRPRRMQLTVAEIAREQSQQRGREQHPENDAAERARQPKRRSFADQGELKLAAGDAERAQEP